ncbi:HET-domain-containing protein [Lophiostoma macrostomum CBS 122681]|uniref:HET-domain-containing protein n=1 Tax=Lophiostoma macrostomum CBS 122681 TaxID=1314788 RepID=A0A6A6SKT9_9PLEO|nr:HET-domain-containing protein [Lophiostoma macrostomum CBS 122681]
MEDCVQNHRKCKVLNPRNSTLPKRILQLRAPRAFLKEHLQPRPEENYACLSHCWGPQGPTIKLTRNTEETLHRGMPIDDLPNTFAEAARVCLKLGITNLWIDALCIRQDDVDDWREAAATMAGIYENAFVTIAALCGKGSNDGLRPSFGDRFKIKKLRDTDLYVRQAYLEFPSRVNPDDTSVWPLLWRAWVFQEMWLSPRVIYFSAFQVTWQCHTASRSQDGFCDTGFANEEGPEDPERFWLGQWKDPVAAWHIVVDNYSKLNLTYESDRLPALAALADKMLQFRKSDAYIAGVWRNSLLSDIGWVTSGYRKHRTPNSRIPTWSWASLTLVGGIRYSFQNPHIISSVKVVDCSYTAIGPVNTGRVHDATITLRGPLLNFVANAVRLYGEDAFRVADSHFDPNKFAFMTSPDCDLVDAESPPVFNEIFKALLLYDGTDDKEWRVGGFGLLLREISDGEYIRIGAVEIFPTPHRSGLQDHISQEWLDNFIADLPVGEVSIV